MVFHVNFNNSNQILSRMERHMTYMGFTTTESCSSIASSLPPDERCHFVTTSKACRKEYNIINYVAFFYCTMKPYNVLYECIAILLYLSVLAFLFATLAIISDFFFCPSLAVLARILGLSENVAGVTLVALGNGAPDIFTAMELGEIDVNDLVATVFANTIFVVCIVCGLMIVLKPFRAQGFYLMRDCLFLILGTVFVEYSVRKDQIMSLLESILIILLYVIYLIVAFMDQYLVKVAVKELEIMRKTVVFPEFDMTELTVLRSQAILQYSTSALHDVKSYTMAEDLSQIMKPNTRLMSQFLHSINPIPHIEWTQSNWGWRVFLILRAPILLTLLLLVPRLDMDLEGQGWSKFLNCTQITTLPFIMSLKTFSLTKRLYMPICVWIFLITLPITIAAFRSSRTDHPPTFHRYFCLLSVTGSAFVVYHCCAEIIGILTVLGVVTGRTSSLFECTLLAWGNSMGDLMANIALARAGYQHMALAACFGGPLFNLLLIVGLILLGKYCTMGDYSIENFGMGTMGENPIIFLGFVLKCFLIGACTTGFVLRISQGVLLIVFYIIFFVFMLLCEFEIVHGYGTDHRMESDTF